MMKIAEAAFPTTDETGALPTSVRMVLVDVAAHPGSSISEITTRTGFPQSHVSASVARLRDRGVLDTTIDIGDGRRTLVTLAERVRHRAATRRPVPIENELGLELGSPNPEDLAKLTGALELLAEHLIPKARRLARTIGSG